MKKKVFLLLVISLSLLAQNPVTPPKIMVGVGPTIGSNGFGASARLLIQDQFGVSLTMGSAFNLEQWGGELQANYRFLQGRRVNPYMLLGGGFQSVDVYEVTPTQLNVVIPVFSAGAGAEMLLGNKHQHGLSLETAWRSGAIEYRSASTTDIGQDGQTTGEMEVKELPHFSVSFLYHFYFLSRN